MRNNAETEATSRHLACKQHENAVHEVHVLIRCLNKPVTATVTDHVPEGITSYYVITMQHEFQCKQDRVALCRFDEGAAARAAARTSDSLAAMGVLPSMVGSGSGPPRAASQPQGFAAMAPAQGMLGPPPPFQQRNAPRQPPPSSNANAHAGFSSSAYQSDVGNGYGYGQSPPFAAASRPPSGQSHGYAAQAASRPPSGQSHGYAAQAAAQAAADFPSDIFGPIQHSNGIAAHPDPKQAQRGAQFHSDSQAQAMPKAGDWNKELWATNSDRSAPGYSWIQQQQQQQTGQSQSQQRQSAGPGYEQMPPIPAQHAAAATRQKAASAPAPAGASDLSEWVFF